MLVSVIVITPARGESGAPMLPPVPANATAPAVTLTSPVNVCPLTDRVSVPTPDFVSVNPEPVSNTSTTTVAARLVATVQVWAAPRPTRDGMRAWRPPTG